MRAWVLLTPPVAALGDRPLVFWIDKKKGVAFAWLTIRRGASAISTRYRFRIQQGILSRDGKDGFTQVAGDQALCRGASGRIKP